MDTGPSPTDQRISIIKATKAAKETAEKNCTCPCCHITPIGYSCFGFLLFNRG
jgi:hypothetical protein